MVTYVFFRRGGGRTEGAAFSSFIRVGRERLCAMVQTRFIAMMRAIVLLSVLLLGTIGAEPRPRRTPPKNLSETGLYSDISTKTIAATNLMFSPQYPLWSDGARKKRWIYLP